MKNLINSLLLIVLSINTYAQNDLFSSLQSSFDSLGIDSTQFRCVQLNEDTIIYHSFGDSTYLERVSYKNPQNLAHLSSVFTYALFEKAIEAGKIDSLALVREYLPTFPYQNIQIRHLVNHQSGLPHDYLRMFHRKIYQDRNVKMNDKQNGVDNIRVMDMLIKFQPPLSFDPGTQKSYSNTNMILLSMALEKVFLKSFEDLMMLYFSVNTVEELTFELAPQLIYNDTTIAIYNLTQMGFDYPDHTIGHHGLLGSPFQVVQALQSLKQPYLIPFESGLNGFRCLYAQSEKETLLVFINMEFAESNEISLISEAVSRLFPQ